MIVVSELRDPYLKKYQEKPLFFSLNKGEFVILKGANGVGKTTLLKLISGIKKQKAGSVTVQVPFGYLPFQNPLYSELKVKDYLSQDTLFFDFWQRTDSYQDIKNTYIGNLSEGQKRQIALYLITPFPLWIMDEPTTALDNEKRLVLYKRIQEHCEQSGGALCASHDLCKISKSRLFFLD